MFWGFQRCPLIKLLRQIKGSDENETKQTKTGETCFR